jgi:hypothetical protein
MDIYESRRLVLLDVLRRSFDGRQAALAAAIKVSPSYLTRMLKEPGDTTKKSIGDLLAQRIEEELGLPAGALLNPQVPGRSEESTGAQPSYAKAGKATVLHAAEPLRPYGEGLLEDLNDLLPEDADRFRDELEKHAKLVEQLRAEIHARAEQMRRHSRYLLTKTGAKGVASAEKVKHIPVAPKVGDPEGGAGKGERRGRSHVPPEPSPSRRP